MDSEERMKINWEEQSGKLWHTYGRHVLAIFVVVLLVHDVFGTHGFMAMHRKQQEIQKVSKTLERLNKENTLLEQDISGPEDRPADHPQNRAGRVGAGTARRDHY